MSRSCCTHSHCPGYNSCCIWIIFHTIVVHDPRMCHDLETRSYMYIQGQGQTAHITIILVRAITLLCWISKIFHSIVVHDPRVCHDLDPMSNLQVQGQATHIAMILVWACPSTTVVVSMACDNFQHLIYVLHYHFTLQLLLSFRCWIWHGDNFNIFCVLLQHHVPQQLFVVFQALAMAWL